MDAVFAEGIQDEKDKTNTEDNEAAIKDFGIKKGEPIDKGFFFWKGEFVAPPYVVEARGLDVYINNILVWKGPTWPQPASVVESVRHDPGDPPANVSPDDHYWFEKWNYLIAHNSREKTEALIIAIYKKCPKVKEARRHPRIPEGFTIVDQQGEEWNISFAILGKGMNPSKEVLIKTREDKLQWFTDPLNRSGCLIGMRPPLTEWRCVGRKAVMLLDTLLSDAEKQQKVDKILQIGWSIDLKTEQDQEIIAEFRESGTVGEIERLVENFHRTETFVNRFEKRRNEMLNSGQTEPDKSKRSFSVPENPIPRPPYGK